MFYWYIKIPMAGWAPGWPPECGTCCVFPTSTMTHGAPGEAADAFLMGGMGYTRDSLKKWIMSTAIPWCSKKILNWPPFSVGFLGFKTCHSLLIYPFSWLRLLEAYCLDPTREGLTFELWVKNCWPKMHSFYQERPVRNDVVGPEAQWLESVSLAFCHSPSVQGCRQVWTLQVLPIRGGLWVFCFSAIDRQIFSRTSKV